MYLFFFSLVNVCVWEPNRLSADENVSCIGNCCCREKFCWRGGKVGGGQGGGGGWKGGKEDVDKNGCWQGIVGGGGCCEKNDSGGWGDGGSKRLLLLLLLLNSCLSCNLFNLFLIIKFGAFL